jgi:hypothetical protein
MVGIKCGEQKEKFAVFEAWVRVIISKTVPNEVRIFHLYLDPRVAKTKEPVHELFYGFELVEWTRKIPYNRSNWDAERDGLKGEQTTRCFAQMPDSCFDGNVQEADFRKPWDAFGECSMDDFYMCLQRVEGAWVDFKCTMHNDTRRWRAYLYKS